MTDEARQACFKRAALRWLKLCSATTCETGKCVGVTQPIEGKASTICGPSLVLWSQGENGSSGRPLGML